jgi:hypothetical protein
MTLATTSNTTVVQGNGLTTSFDFTFPVPNASELFVYYTAVGLSPVLLSSSLYSTTGVGTENGGTVNYPLVGSPIPTGSSLTIQREVEYVQLTSLVNQSGYYPNVVENALDYLTMQTQQLAQTELLTIQVPLESSLANLILPTKSARADTLVGFDALGNAVTYPVTASVGAGNLTPEGPFVSGVDFTPNVTTTLTLSQSYGTVANVRVQFDGVLQGFDQYSLSGNNIVFTQPIPLGTSKVYIVGGTTLSQGIPPDGSVSVPTLAADTLLLIGSKVAYITTIAASDMTDIEDGTTVIAQGRDTVSDGGGGVFRYSASSSQTVDGGTIFAPNAGTGRLFRDGWTVFGYNGPSNAAWFGVKMDNSTDNTAAMALCATYLSEFAQVQELHFNPGINRYATSPNFGIQNAVIIGHGECHFQYTGTGYGLILDGSALPNLGAYNVTMRGITVDSNASAFDGVFINYCHHSTFDRVKCRGAGPTYAGIKTGFCVASRFENCEVSPNADGGWFGGAMPMYGIHVTGPSAVLQTSYCTFINTVCEGLNQTNGAGIFIECSLGNQFYGGTSEGSKTGILTANAAAGCVSNKFFGMDMEANSVQDIYEQGFENEYWSCDTNLLINVIGNSLRPQFYGGQHQSISIASGSSYPSFTRLVWNRNGSGTFVDGSGTARGLGTCFDHINNKPGPFSQTVLSPGTSPYIYTNTKGSDTLISVSVSGGTVSQVEIFRNAVGTLTPQVTGLFSASPNDQYEFTFTGTLAVTEFTK